MSSKSPTAVAASTVPSRLGTLSAFGPVPARQVHATQSLGKYRLGARILLSDTGSLHLGEVVGSTRVSRFVAIKRLTAAQTRNLKLRERFRSEARIHAGVRDPNVVRLLDLVESDGELWQIFEYVDGEPLLALQTDAAAWGRQLPIDVSIAILVGALRGLHAAHSARHENGSPLGVVHRAVAPQTILISRLGQIKISDFSSARTRLSARSFDLARLDDNVSYLSPEQVRGSAVDRRSDVFSAGVVLWEALTGRSLFRAGNESEALVLDNIEHQPIPIPSSLRAEIPKALDEVVLCALRRETAQRFDSALEFALALEELLVPAPASIVGSYLNVYCEGRLAQRQHMLRGTESTVPSREGPGRTGSFTQTPDDEFEAVTLPAIPSAAPESSLRPVSRTAKSEPARESKRVLWACAAAAGLIVLTGFSWRVSRPAHRIDGLASAPMAVAQRAPQLNASPPIALDLAKKDTSEQPVGATKLSATQLGTLRAPNSEFPAISSESTSGDVAPRRAVSLANQSASPIANQPSRALQASSAMNVDCTPPTYLGADGIRHFKEQCL